MLEDLIVKPYSNVVSDGDYQKGKRIWRKLDFDSSGMIDYINTRSKELGISGEEFVYSDYADEVRYRYDYNLNAQKKSFCKKFGEYLV